MKKNKNKNNGDQSNPDEEYWIQLHTLIHEPTNQSDVPTESSKEPGVNYWQETVLI